MESSFKKVSWLRWVGSLYVDFMIFNVFNEAGFALANKRDYSLFGYVFFPLYFVVFRFLKSRTVGQYFLKLERTLVEKNGKHVTQYYVEPVNQLGTYLPWYFDLFGIIELNSSLKLIARTWFQFPVQLFYGRLIEGLPAQLWASVSFLSVIWFTYCLFRANRYVFISTFLSLGLGLSCTLSSLNAMPEFFQRYQLWKYEMWGRSPSNVSPEWVIYYVFFASILYSCLLLSLLIWKRKIFLKVHTYEP